MSPHDAPDAPAAGGGGAAELRQRILGRENKLGEVTVHVPQWQTDVLVIELTGEKRAELLQAAMAGQTDGAVNLKRIYPDLVIHTAHHPATRERLFEPADREALLQDSGAALEAIATAAGQISGMDPGAAARAEGN